MASMAQETFKSAFFVQSGTKVIKHLSFRRKISVQDSVPSVQCFLRAQGLAVRVGQNPALTFPARGRGRDGTAAVKV
jgi:hypothetical protein